MKHLKIYENYIHDLIDLIKFKRSGIKIGDKVRFVEGVLPYAFRDIIWVVDKLDYKEYKFNLVSCDENKHRTQVYISEIDEIKKLEDHEVDAEKYNL